MCRGVEIGFLVSWNRLFFCKKQRKANSESHFTTFCSPVHHWHLSVIITWLALSWAADLCCCCLLSSTYNQHTGRERKRPVDQREQFRLNRKSLLCLVSLSAVWEIEQGQQLRQYIYRRSFTCFNIPTASFIVPNNYIRGSTKIIQLWITWQRGLLQRFVSESFSVSLPALLPPCALVSAEPLNSFAVVSCCAEASWNYERK